MICIPESKLDYVDSWTIEIERYNILLILERTNRDTDVEALLYLKKKSQCIKIHQNTKEHQPIHLCILKHFKNATLNKMLFFFFRNTA